jgi:phosphohistidine phosphatase
MERGAAGLRTLVPEIDVLATSPLTRAVQTAQIVAVAYDGMRVEPVEALGSGDVEGFLEWLRDCEPSDVVAAVGHEPHMSDWAAWLLTGRWEDLAAVKKGSALLLEFPSAIRAGEARLLWFLTPAQLRGLGR